MFGRLRRAEGYRPPMRRSLTCSIIAGLLVAACGSGSSGGAAADPADDKAAAQRATAAVDAALQDDGFTTAPPDDSSNDDLTFTSQTCKDFGKAFPKEDEKLPGETAKDEIDLEQGALDAGGTMEEVKVTVGFVEDATDVDEFFELFGDDRLPGCLEEAIMAEFTNQAEGGGPPVSVDALDVTTTDVGQVGDETVALQVEATLSAGGASFPFQATFALAREGRAVAQVDQSTIGDADPAADLHDLLALALDTANR